MIRINDVRLASDHTEQDINRILSGMGVRDPRDAVLSRLSLDARKKNDVHYLASFDIRRNDLRLRPRGGAHITDAAEKCYAAPEPGSRPLPGRPVIIGAGPAGMFAGLLLALNGYAPLIIERGAPADERTLAVNGFWNTGKLDPETNACFGEGGAGTFSDGKLSTGIKDKSGRIRQILVWFYEAGADRDILYWHKPHIGSDVLPGVMMNIRKRTEEAGGEYRFHTRAESLLIENGIVKGVLIKNEQGNTEQIDTGCVIAAIGHSARDTVKTLYAEGVPMEAKNFAVGLRIEHPRKMIDCSQYGAAAAHLPAADYKLTAQEEHGHGVYSFCMCPGGSVIDSSSEPGRLCVNGMSLKARAGRNSNAALVVGIGPADFGPDVFSGMEYQIRIEEAAYRAGSGKIPVQLLGDFMNGRETKQLGDVIPDIRGSFVLSELRGVLTDRLSSEIIGVIPSFGRRIQGFDRPDAVLSGIESRTSSPVRMIRDEHMESAVKGLFPCGEGAGYAGGITSAAVDGMKAAEEIIGRYRPWT